MKEIAQAAVDGLKAQPALLATVVVNVISLIFFAYVLHEISTAKERSDVLLGDIIKKCQV